MQKFGKVVDNRVVYAPQPLEYDGHINTNPSDEMYLAAGYLPVRIDNDTIVSQYNIEQTDTEIVVYQHVVIMPTPEEQRIEEINVVLNDITPLTEAIERLIATMGTTESDRAMAEHRIALRDELGKIIQTDEGDGSDMNPFKWTDGQEVIEGMWYKTPSTYIWQAIATGIPANETDSNFFDVVGL